MSQTAIEQGRAALAAALARAGKRASTAAVIAAVVPLGMMAASTSAEAVASFCSCTSVTGTVTAAGEGVYNYQYVFTTTGAESKVTRLELPELRVDEFLSNGSGGFLGTIPAGWNVSQVLESPFGANAATFKNAALKPAAFIELTPSGDAVFLGSGQGMTLVLQSRIGASVGANMEVGLIGGEGFSIDPPSPNPNATPEPGSLAVLGSALAGLAGLARRKKKA